MVAISFQAPTWTLVRLQPLEHQLYFANTPILDLREQTFCQDTNLGLKSTNSQGLQSFLFLRHQPQGLQSNLTSEAPASRTPIQSHFWGTSLKDSYPSHFWGTNPKDSNPSSLRTLLCWVLSIYSFTVVSKLQYQWQPCLLMDESLQRCTLPMHSLQ